MKPVLRINDVIPNCQALGPGNRFVVSLQGCSLGCAGCIVPQTHSTTSGKEISIDELFQQITKEKETDGVTFIGGEPMEQAQSLVALTSMIKEKTSLNVFTYTGFTMQDLLSQKDPARLKLIQLSDMICDGPFEQELSQKDLLWRGSNNQKIYVFSDSLRKHIDSIKNPVQFEINFFKDHLQVMGIPSQAFLLDISKQECSQGM